MSQNRQSVKDRLDATHDYQVNLKAELEILSLHEKLDELRDQKWGELIQMQQKQIDLLMQLLKEHKTALIPLILKPLLYFPLLIKECRQN
jgi:uncharacterized membrane protein